MGMPRMESPLVIGGQALIEGVMMRADDALVISVRQPDNTIVTHVQRVQSLRDRVWVLGFPFIRGMVALFETVVVGVRSMVFSANISLDEEEEFSFFDYVLLFGMLVLMSGLFTGVPFVVTSFLGVSGVFFSFVESFVRLLLFGVYLWVVSRWGEVSRVLQYHGAEHKVINAYEDGAVLVPEVVSGYSRVNGRCGTSFMFLTILISLVLFSLIPEVSFVLRLVVRLLLIPVVGGVSYEVLRLGDGGSWFFGLLVWPGLVFQGLTTGEPSLDMIEVAIRSLEGVLEVVG